MAMKIAITNKIAKINVLNRFQPSFTCCRRVAAQVLLVCRRCFAATEVVRCKVPALGPALIICIQHVNSNTPAAARRRWASHARPMTHAADIKVKSAADAAVAAGAADAAVAAGAADAAVAAGAADAAVDAASKA
jgi:hypothetical protein